MDSSSSADTPAQGASADTLAAAETQRAEAFGRGVELVPGLPPIVSATEELAAAETDPPPAWILEGLFEAGDKALLIAPPKTGKTWAALTIAEHLAAGRDFWGFHVERPHRVLYVNLEVKDRWMRRRLRGACAVDGIGVGDGLDGMQLMNARGKGESVRDAIEANPAAFAAFDLVILDPFYKLARPGEDENSSRDVKGILDAVDKLAAAGPAVLTVKHDGKGDVGSKRATDRGAGSYAAAADYDAALILTAHKDGKPRVVVEVVARNSRGRDPFVIRFEKAPDGVNGGAFVLDEETAPEKETDATRKNTAGGVAKVNVWLQPLIYQNAAKTALIQCKDGLAAGALIVKIQDATNASEKTVRNRLKAMLADGFLKTEKKGRETIYTLANPDAITPDEEANALADK